MDNSQQIVQAILELKQENNVIKDYIFPIAMALFSSFFGALFAYFVFHKQEKIVVERMKLETVNKWILLADEIHQSLIAIKSNYWNNLTNEPYQRIFAIPSILLNEENFSFPYHELAFLSSSKNSKWNNISYLRTLFSNYPSLLKMWEMRNTLNDKIKSQMIESIGINSTFIDVSTEDIQKYVDQSELACLIDINERVIRLTDDLIVEFYNFLNEFPEAAKYKVDLNLIKKYGSILQYNINENEKLKAILKEAPLPDFTQLTNILGRSEGELKERYSPLFGEYSSNNI